MPYVSKDECPVCACVVNESGESPPDGHTVTCPDCGTKLRFEVDGSLDEGAWRNESRFVVVRK